MKASKKTGSNSKLLPNVLSAQQLANLSAHKYASTGTTLLDPIFQPFWVWTVNKLPMNIAPNLLTITGLIINVVTSLLMMFYSPNADVSVRS
jgi:choline/ethanolamine phosphotransferase